MFKKVKKILYLLICYILMFPVVGFGLSGRGDDVSNLLGDIDKTVSSTVKILILAIILGPLAVILFFASVSGVKAYNRAKNDQVENPSSAALTAFGKIFVIGMFFYLLGTVFANKVFFEGNLFSYFTQLISDYLNLR